MTSPNASTPGTGLDERGLIELVLSHARASAPTRAWLFRESLPPGHALLPLAEAGFAPALARDGRDDANHAIDLVFEHPEQGWRLLVVLTARVTQRLSREYHDTTRARAAAAKEAREVSGSVVVVLAPRRYARDSGNAQRFTRTITLENLGEHFAERAAAEPESAEVLRAMRRDLRDAAERQVRHAAEEASAKVRAAWGEYDAVLAGYAAHLAVRSRGVNPGSDVLFVIGPGRAVDHLPVAALRHGVKESRAALDLVLPHAAVVAPRLRDDLPMDIYIDVTPTGLTLWLRLPPLDPRGRLSDHSNDLRHAFGALWRLKNWYLRHTEHCPRWRGVAPPRERPSE